MRCLAWESRTETTRDWGRGGPSGESACNGDRVSVGEEEEKVLEMHECTQCPWTGHLDVVNTANVVLCILYQNKENLERSAPCYSELRVCLTNTQRLLCSFIPRISMTHQQHRRHSPQH